MLHMRIRHWMSRSNLPILAASEAQKRTAGRLGTSGAASLDGDSYVASIAALRLEARDSALRAGEASDQRPVIVQYRAERPPSTGRIAPVM